MALALSTEIELTTGESIKLSDLDLNNEEYFVYSILPSGRIRTSKIKSLNILPSQKVSKFNFKNGNHVIVDDKQDFILHDGSEYTTEDKKFYVALSFNPKNDRVYDHAAKLYYNAEKIAYETYDLYNEAYEGHNDRNILELLGDKVNNIKDHIELIKSVTGSKLQLLLRLSIDVHMLGMLELEYLTVKEVETICDYLNIEYKDGTYTEAQKQLLQILMENIPEDYSATFEEYIENIKNNADLLTIGELANRTDIQDDITKEQLDEIALTLGYSFISHLKSIAPMYGTQLLSIDDLENPEDCAIIELEDSDTIGLSCGIFVNTNI